MWLEEKVPIKAVSTVDCDNRTKPFEKKSPTSRKLRTFLRQKRPMLEFHRTLVFAKRGAIFWRILVKI